MRRYSSGMYGRSIGREALTDDQLRAAVPSIFADEAHESRSARFHAIPTINVVRKLRSEGFEPFFAAQSRTRDAERASFTKHMLRMRHRSIQNDDGQAFEVILVNANDGSSSYQMLPGFFRFVCQNGLMVGETFSEIRVSHRKRSIADDVIEGAYEVLGEAPRVMDEVDRMKRTVADAGARMRIARAAHEARFPLHYLPQDSEKRVEAPVEADRFLSVHRSADAQRSVWNTLNVAQEHAVRGGLRYTRRDAEMRVRRGSVRAVQGIDQIRKINRSIWSEAADVLAEAA